MRRGKLLAAAAVLSVFGVVAGPMSAAGSVTDEAGTQATAAAGRKADACAFYHGFPRACVKFWPNDEIFRVCDTSADGLTARGEIRFGGDTHKFKDNNGAKRPCNKKDFNIAEGTTVKVRACVVGKGCTRWVTGRA